MKLIGALNMFSCIPFYLNTPVVLVLFSLVSASSLDTCVWVIVLLAHHARVTGLLDRPSSISAAGQ